MPQVFCSRVFQILHPTNTAVEETTSIHNPPAGSDHLPISKKGRTGLDSVGSEDSRTHLWRLDLSSRAAEHGVPALPCIAWR